MSSPLLQVGSAIQIQLHIQPNAAKTEVVGLHGNRLKIRIQAPPVEGKANAELVRFLSETLGVSRASVSVVRGESGRQKTVTVAGLSLVEAAAKLGLKI